jgi:hypothetical protein
VFRYFQFNILHMLTVMYMNNTSDKQFLSTSKVERMFLLSSAACSNPSTKQISPPCDNRGDSKDKFPDI